MKIRDRMRVGPEIEPGRGAAIRQRGEEISVGTFVEIKEGQPIPEGAELVRLDPESEDGWRNVTSLYARESSGPAQVATPEYREGYDRIFGKKQKVGLA